MRLKVSQLTIVNGKEEKIQEKYVDIKRGDRPIRVAVIDGEIIEIEAL